jgi:hypothetical protein
MHPATTEDGGQSFGDSEAVILSSEQRKLLMSTPFTSASGAITYNEFCALAN